MSRDPFPRLVIDNSRNITGLAVRGEVPVKLLKSVDGEAASRLNPTKKFSVVHNELAQAGKRNTALFTEARRIVQKLIATGHCAPSVLTRFHYEGFTPRSSTGFFPHEESEQMRDNSLMSDLAKRIQQRLDALDKTANAVSDDAGLERGYITDIFVEARNGVTRSPRANTLKRLAEALECDFTWLSTGDGSPTLDPDERRRRLHKLIDNLPSDNLDAATTVIEALNRPDRASA